MKNNLTRFGKRLRYGFLRALTLTLTLAFAAEVVNAQVVTVTDSQVYWDGASLILDGLFGEDSEERYVRVRNQSSSTIDVRVHIHSGLEFVWFRYTRGGEGHVATFSVPPRESFTLGVHAYLRSGTTKQYHDDLGFDVTYGRGGTAYVEVPLSAYIYHPTRQEEEGQAPVKPPNYHALKTATGQPKHCHLSHLPLKVYSNHRAFGVSADFDGVFLRALNVWNAAAQSINLGRAFFEPATDRSQADIVVDWSGNGLGPDHLGAGIAERYREERMGAYRVRVYSQRSIWRSRSVKLTSERSGWIWPCAVPYIRSLRPACPSECSSPSRWPSSWHRVSTVSPMFLAPGGRITIPTI